jgi:hypothetical protein
VRAAARKVDPIREELGNAIRALLDAQPAADALELLTDAETIPVSYAASDFGFLVRTWEWAETMPLRRYTLVLDWTGTTP